jgi:NTE family protein
VVGSRTVLGRMVMARSIGAMPAALGGDVRWASRWKRAAPTARKSAALGRAAAGSQRFVAVDTRFGPLYFGAGTTKGGNSSAYLFLGPIW